MKKLFHALAPGFIVFIALILASCGGSSSPSATGGSTPAAAALNIAFLPKAVNNPYFDTAAAGGKSAAGELKGTFKQVGPSTASGTFHGKCF